MANPQTQNIIGQVVANCKIESKLGAGGMGAVFLGEHQGLRNKVAIKILPAVPPPPQQFVQRFFREARALAQLEHKNIVHVYDVGQQDPYYYIVMQYIEATPLENYVREKGRFSISKALRIIRDTADAMAYAHERGILHRDLKPDNVLYDEKTGEVKIIDFGLAKFEGGGESQALTVTGQIMGTPMYMAPEQAEGKTADHRTDIYSLGALGFYALTGDFPFTGKSGMDILLKKIREKPRNILELRPEIPQPVASLINKMMARDPEKRFQSMARVRDILNQALKPKGGDKAAADAQADDVINQVRQGGSRANLTTPGVPTPSPVGGPTGVGTPPPTGVQHSGVGTPPPTGVGSPTGSQSPAWQQTGANVGSSTVELDDDQPTVQGRRPPTLEVGGGIRREGAGSGRAAGAGGGQPGGTNTRTVIIILLLILIAGGIAFGGWFLYTQNQKGTQDGPGNGTADNQDGTDTPPSQMDEREARKRWLEAELLARKIRDAVESSRVDGKLPVGIDTGIAITQYLEALNIKKEDFGFLDYFSPTDFTFSEYDPEAGTYTIQVRGSRDESPRGLYTLNQDGDDHLELPPSN